MNIIFIFANFVEVEVFSCSPDALIQVTTVCFQVVFQSLVFTVSRSSGLKAFI